MDVFVVLIRDPFSCTAVQDVLVYDTHEGAVLGAFDYLAGSFSRGARLCRPDDPDERERAYMADRPYLKADPTKDHLAELERMHGTLWTAEIRREQVQTANTMPNT